MPRVGFTLLIARVVERVPDWFPGAGFKREAAYSRKLAALVLDGPFNQVKKDIVGEFRIICRVLCLSKVGIGQSTTFNGGGLFECNR